MDFGLRERTALVLGGGGGLGKVIAKSLAAEGARIAVADIDSVAAERSVQEIRESGKEAAAIAWNIADLSAIDANVRTIENLYGPVEVLVNITGGPPPTPAAGQAPGSWAKHFGAMVVPVIAITDRVLPSMRSRRWGRVITSGSSGMVSPIPNLAISNTLRLALLGWSKTLAREVARDGITVNVVLPGRIATERVRFLDEARAKREGRTAEQVAEASAASIPMGRYGTPEEYAQAVAFLASDCASYITGSVLRVDGGLISSI